MNPLNKVVDERFLRHRQRSSSLAGIVGGTLATSLFAWRYYVDHLWNWDLLAVSLTIMGVKIAVMIWSNFTD